MVYYTSAALATTATFLVGGCKYDQQIQQQIIEVLLT